MNIQDNSKVAVFPDLEYTDIVTLPIKLRNVKGLGRAPEVRVGVSPVIGNQMQELAENVMETRWLKTTALNRSYNEVISHSRMQFVV